MDIGWLPQSTRNTQFHFICLFVDETEIKFMTDGVLMKEVEKVSS